jgi:hypothetical protein
MRKIIPLLAVCLFFIWLLPLGVFIKPSQEKIACGGQRAICLCSNAASNAKKTPTGGYGLKTNSSNKESSASNGKAGHEYLVLNPFVVNNSAIRLDQDSMFVAYRNPYLKLIEHIPKV